MTALEHNHRSQTHSLGTSWAPGGRFHKLARRVGDPAASRDILQRPTRELRKGEQIPTPAESVVALVLPHAAECPCGPLPRGTLPPMTSLWRKAP